MITFVSEIKTKSNNLTIMSVSEIETNSNTTLHKCAFLNYVLNPYKDILLHKPTMNNS